jgi:hypothetical protein
MPTYLPQDLLDLLHTVDIPGLFAENMPIKERATSIKLARQKLRQIKRQIKQEQDVIRHQWDGRHKEEALRQREELAPYEVLHDVSLQAETAITVLQTSIELGKPLPVAPVLGTVIIEDHAVGKWVIVSAEAAVRLIKLQYQRMITDLKERIDNAEQWLSSQGPVWSPLIWYGSLALLCVLLLFYLAPKVPLNSQSGLAVYGLLGLLLMLCPLIAWGKINEKRKARSAKRQFIENSHELLQKMHRNYGEIIAQEHGANDDVVERAAPALPAASAEQLRQAYKLAKAGNRDEAKRILKDVLSLDPTNADVWYLAAYLSDTKEDRITALTVALELNPAHSGAKKVLAQLQRESTQ